MTDSLRPLKILVVTLGIMIIIGMLIVVGTIIKRSITPLESVAIMEMGTIASDSSKLGLDNFGTQNIALPSGSKLVDTLAEGERLILIVDQADGLRQIMLLNMTTGKPIGKILIKVKK